MSLNIRSHAEPCVLLSNCCRLDACTALAQWVRKSQTRLTLWRTSKNTWASRLNMSTWYQGLLAASKRLTSCHQVTLMNLPSDVTYATRVNTDRNRVQSRVGALKAPCVFPFWEWSSILEPVLAPPYTWRVQAFVSLKAQFQILSIVFGADCSQNGLDHPPVDLSLEDSSGILVDGFERTYDGKLKCRYCNYATRGTARLIEHIRIHTGKSRSSL